jgi:hypothetical protein
VGAGTPVMGGNLSTVKTWNDSSVPQARVEKILDSVGPPANGTPRMSSARRAAAELCLGLILTRWIRRMDRAAASKPLHTVRSGDYTEVEEACEHLKNLVAGLEDSDDPPSKEWARTSLDDLMFWARCGRSLTSQGGRPRYPHWRVVSELIAFYDLVLARNPSGSEANGERSLGSQGTRRPPPTMRFLAAAFSEVEPMLSPVSLPERLQPPSPSRIGRKLLESGSKAPSAPESRLRFKPLTYAKLRVVRSMRKLDASFRVTLSLERPSSSRDGV